MINDLAPSPWYLKHFMSTSSVNLNSWDRPIRLSLKFKENIITKRIFPDGIFDSLSVFFYNLSKSRDVKLNTLFVRFNNILKPYRFQSLFDFIKIPSNPDEIGFVDVCGNVINLQEEMTVEVLEDFTVAPISDFSEITIPIKMCEDSITRILAKCHVTDTRAELLEILYKLTEITFCVDSSSINHFIQTSTNNMTGDQKVVEKINCIKEVLNGVEIVQQELVLAEESGDLSVIFSCFRGVKASFLHFESVFNLKINNYEIIPENELSGLSINP